MTDEFAAPVRLTANGGVEAAAPGAGDNLGAGTDAQTTGAYPVDSVRPGSDVLATPGPLAAHYLAATDAAIDRMLARHGRPPYKVCGCGAAYSSTDWQALSLRGVQAGELELRDCLCGSTLAVPLPTLDCPDCDEPIGYGESKSCDCGAVVAHVGCRLKHGCDGDDGRLMGPGYEP
jgi:hypothetical protein